MWAQNILLAVIGLSAGVIVASGLFSFVIELGVVSDFADRTHTGEHILLTRERTENRKRDFVFFENTAEQGGKKPDKTPCEHLKRRPRTLPEKNI